MNWSENVLLDHRYEIPKKGLKRRLGVFVFVLIFRDDTQFLIWGSPLTPELEFLKNLWGLGTE
jgi:hypothetical protein